MTKQSAIVLELPQAALAKYKQSINEALERFFDDVPDMLELQLSAVSQGAIKKLEEYSLRPGKRIRGSLAAAAYDFATKSHLGEAGLRLGVALELIQSYLLIVDDVMDRSELRRGQPTIHQLYAEQADEQGSMHEANMLAINVGLVAQHLANLALVRTPEKPERVVAALERLHINVTATGFGQIDDLYQQVGRTVTDQDILRKYRFKSSYYTFINPLQAGLALGGVTKKKLYDEVASFGEAAGIAFQLQDDFIGIFGDSSSTGKSSVDDIKEGKYTMLVHYALRHTGSSVAAELRQMLGNDRIGAGDMRRAQEIFRSSGAKAFVQAEIQNQAALAKKRLAASSVWDEPFKGFLEALVDYSVNRQV